jgi:hypothetical protein
MSSFGHQCYKHVWWKNTSAVWCGMLSSCTFAHIFLNNAIFVGRFSIKLKRKHENSPYYFAWICVTWGVKFYTIIFCKPIAYNNSVTIILGYDLDNQISNKRRGKNFHFGNFYCLIFLYFIRSSVVGSFHPLPKLRMSEAYLSTNYTHPSMA